MRSRFSISFPEIAAVGLTEKEAEEKYDNVRVGKFPFRANAKAFVLDEMDGMVKFITDAQYGQVLGVGIIGRVRGCPCGPAGPHPSLARRQRALGLGRASTRTRLFASLEAVFFFFLVRVPDQGSCSGPPIHLCVRRRGELAGDAS